MFTFFSQNIFILRKAHNLTILDLSNMINLKSKGTLSLLENNKTLPSYDTLINLSNLFAVSVDWLVGRSSAPYVEEIILTFERDLLSLSCTSNNIPIKLLRYPFIPEEYLNENTRKKLYSLPIRANLIFLLRFKVIQIKTALEITSGLKMDNIQNNSTKILSILETYYCENNKKHFDEVNNFYLHNLSLLLKRQQTIPIFDITKNYSE